MLNFAQYADHCGLNAVVFNDFSGKRTFCEFWIMVFTREVNHGSWWFWTNEQMREIALGVSSQQESVNHLDHIRCLDKILICHCSVKRRDHDEHKRYSKLSPSSNRLFYNLEYRPNGFKWKSNEIEENILLIEMNQLPVVDLQFCRRKWYPWHYLSTVLTRISKWIFYQSKRHRVCCFGIGTVIYLTTIKITIFQRRMNQV